MPCCKVRRGFSRNAMSLACSLTLAACSTTWARNRASSARSSTERGSPPPLFGSRPRVPAGPAAAIRRRSSRTHLCRSSRAHPTRGRSRGPDGPNRSPDAPLPPDTQANTIDVDEAWRTSFQGPTVPLSRMSTTSGEPHTWCRAICHPLYSDQILLGGSTFGSHRRAALPDGGPQPALVPGASS